MGYSEYAHTNLRNAMRQQQLIQRKYHTTRQKTRAVSADQDRDKDRETIPNKGKHRQIQQTTQNKNKNSLFLLCPS